MESLPGQVGLLTEGHRVPVGRGRGPALPFGKHLTRSLRPYRTDHTARRGQGRTRPGRDAQGQGGGGPRRERRPRGLHEVPGLHRGSLSPADQTRQAQPDRSDRPGRDPDLEGQRESRPARDRGGLFAGQGRPLCRGARLLRRSRGVPPRGGSPDRSRPEGAPLTQVRAGRDVPAQGRGDRARESRDLAQAGRDPGPAWIRRSGRDALDAGEDLDPGGCPAEPEASPDRCGEGFGRDRGDPGGLRDAGEEADG